MDFAIIFFISLDFAGDKGSVVTDYQYEKNTCSDSQFMKDYLEKEDAHQEQATVVTDSVYSQKMKIWQQKRTCNKIISLHSSQI